MPSTYTSYLFLISASLVALMSFMITGPYNMRIDGEIYVSQVLQFESGTLVVEPFDVAIRAFKPLYGLWGAFVGPLFSPMEAIQLLNLFFLLGLPFVAHFFLRECGFGLSESRWGALWVTAGYPVLKYGLAISTDIGGWFLATVTAALALRGIRTASPRTLLLASIAGFIGGTIKEPGVAGLLFGGCFLLCTIRTRKLRETTRLLAALALPALILEGILLYVLTKAGFPNFLDWFTLVRTSDNLESFHTVGKFFGVFASTFNVLIVYGFCGIVALLKRASGIPHVVPMLTSLLLATLPVLLWTFFISRIFYVQFLFMVPLALIGLSYVFVRFPRIPAWCRFGLYSAPVLASVVLYGVAGTRSLFSLFQ